MPGAAWSCVRHRPLTLVVRGRVLDAIEILCALAGLVAAGVIKGATGIGYSSCALPFLVAAVGLQPAVAMLVMPAIATNIAVVVSTGHIRPTLKEFWPLYASTLPGILFGIAIFSSINPTASTKILALAIIAYGAYALLKPDLRLPPALAKAAKMPVGFLSGLLAGMTGSQVLPLVPYMLSLNLDSGRFTQAVNLAVIVTSSFLAVGLFLSNMFDAHDLMLSLAAVVPAIAGVQLGNVIRSRIAAQRYKSVVTLVLVLIGLSLLLR